MHDILSHKPSEKQQKLAWMYFIIFTVYCVTVMYQVGFPSQDTGNIVIPKSQINLMLILQGVVSLFMFGGIAVIFMAVALKIDPLFLMEKTSIKGFLELAGIAILMMISYGFIAEWNMNLELPDSAFSRWARHSEDTMQSMIEQLTNFQSPIHFLLAFLVIGVIAAVSEEYFFRGLLQNLLYRGVKNHHVAIWITALLFSAIHMQFFGFFPRLIIGALLGYVYYWSGNLTAPIIIHFVNNGLGVIAMYISKQTDIGIKAENLDKAPPWYITILALIGLIYFLIKYKKRYQIESE